MRLLGRAVVLALSLGVALAPVSAEAQAARKVYRIGLLELVSGRAAQERRRLPAIYGLREFVEAGGLMAYGTDRRDLYRRSATYAHRILNGANPGDLPVEPPTKFELVINLKSTRALGLTIPRGLLLRADQVIE